MTKHQTRQHHTQASPYLQEIRERERLFLERARAGLDVRNEVVISMQRPLAAIARSIHWRYSQRQGNVIEVSDLVHEASAEILASFRTALTKDEPFSYLYRIARLSMIDCINSRGRTIKSHPDDGEIPVLSLDKPLVPGGPPLADLLPEKHTREKKYLLLHKALETLPETQRTVIQRHFGLLGFAPESLNQVSRVLSPHGSRPSTAYRYYHLALIALRQKLTQDTLPFSQQAKAAGGTR